LFPCRSPTSSAPAAPTRAVPRQRSCPIALAASSVSGSDPVRAYSMGRGSAGQDGSRLHSDAQIATSSAIASAWHRVPTMIGFFRLWWTEPAEVRSGPLEGWGPARGR
jgi:hypothetical protein